MTDSQWYDVPAGTIPVRCKGADCQQLIYFVRNSRGTKTPVDCDVEGANHPSHPRTARAERVNGRGVSHTPICKNAREFYTAPAGNANGGAPTATHQCAVPQCGALIATHLLMCGRHWRMVSPGAQTAVWRTYRDRGPGSEAYKRAVEHAIADVVKQQGQPSLFQNQHRRTT